MRQQRSGEAHAWPSFWGLVTFVWVACSAAMEGGVNLPRANLAVVDAAKVANYLLNPAHPFGASKARFFCRFGFRLEQGAELANALRHHGCQNEVSRVVPSAFGIRFEVDGPLQTPDGRNPRVRTVWQLDERHLAPRLITAYPVEP